MALSAAASILSRGAARNAIRGFARGPRALVKPPPPVRPVRLPGGGIPPSPPPRPANPGLGLLGLALGLKFPLLGLVFWALTNFREENAPGGQDFSQPMVNTVNNSGMEVIYREDVNAYTRYNCSDGSVRFNIAATSTVKDATFTYASEIVWLDPEPLSFKFKCSGPQVNGTRNYLTYNDRRNNDPPRLWPNSAYTVERTNVPSEYSEPPALTTVTLLQVYPRFRPDLNLVPPVVPGGRLPNPDGGTPPEVEPEPLPGTPTIRPPVRTLVPVRVPPVPRSVPLAPPLEPEVEPAGDPAPVPTRTPAKTPVAPPRVPLPLAPPVPLKELNADGLVPVPLADPPPRVTPPGERVIAGVPIKGPVRDVPPTLDAIAAETGRIERKLEALMKNEAGPGDTTDLLQLLMQIWEFLSSAYGAGGYQITGQCHVDSNGDPLDPLTATWDAGFGVQSLVSKKLDALALLLQHHKNLAGHICRKAPPTAPVVSVVFDVDDP